jgi:hypothetical protein
MSYGKCEKGKEKKRETGTDEDRSKIIDQKYISERQKGCTKQ